MLNQLQEVTKRMLEIEIINMLYNKDTNFGTNPNGKEREIELLLKEWDELKIRRNQLKQPK
jgi:hypothetical protein